MDQFTSQFTQAIDEVEKKTATHDGPGIEIHGTIRHLTALYERLRTLIDYQEERFLRRLAIKRILFRRLIIQGNKGKIGEPLVRELIRAAYLENGKLPESTASAIDTILEKYLAALPTVDRRYAPPDLIRMQRRLVGVAAAEIEDYLTPADVEIVLVERLSHEIASYATKEADDHDRMVAMKSLLKADAELVGWRLFALHNSPSREVWQSFVSNPADNVPAVLREVTKYELDLRNRQIEAAVRRFSRLTPPYLILTDLAYQHAEQIHTLIKEPAKLEQTIDTLINERITRTENKIFGSMIRATVYIFVTKVILGIATEVPYDFATLGHIAPVPLIINVLFPPFLMVIAALGIRPPSASNTDVLVRRTKAILLNTELAPIAELEERKRQSWADGLFSIFYFATYAVSFGGLIWILSLLTFNIVSIAVFLFFLSVVGFFAFRIRNSAQELAVVREREGALLLVFDFFALPFLKVGRWLSVTVRQLNIVLFVFDFLIEAPLKVFFVAVEDWFTFLREKREELQ